MKANARVVIVLLLAALIVPWGAVSAQDSSGLSEEEQALVERLQAAILATEEYSSGVIEVEFTLGQEGAITFDGEVVYSELSEEHGKSERTFKRDANGVLNVQGVAVIDHTETDPEGTVSYTLEAERRDVDGVLYIRATRTPAESPDLMPVPVGWKRIDDAESWPALEALDLDDLLDDMDSVGVVDPDMVIMLDHITTITVEEGVTYGGDTVDAIHFSVAGTDYQAALFASGFVEGAQDTVLLAQLSDDSYWDTTVYLDSTDRVVWLSIDTVMVFSEVSLASIAPDAPAGALLSQTLTGQGTRTVYDIGVPVALVEAPELDAVD